MGPAERRTRSPSRRRACSSGSPRSFVLLGDQGDRPESARLRLALQGRLQGRIEAAQRRRQPRGLAREFEPIGGAAQNLPAQGRRGALRDHPALVDDEDPVAGHLDFRQDMAGDDHGHPAAQARDQVADDQDLVGIQADGRLIHDDHRRLGEDRLGDPHPLPKALGQLADDPVADPLQIADLEDLVDPRAKLAPGHLLQPSPEIQVFADPHVLRQRVVLRHVADPALDLVRPGGDGKAADPNVPGGGGKIAGENAHGGGLARPVRPEKAQISPLATVKLMSFTATIPAKVLTRCRPRCKRGSGGMSDRIKSTRESRKIQPTSARAAASFFERDFARPKPPGAADVVAQEQRPFAVDPVTVPVALPGLQNGDPPSAQPIKTVPESAKFPACRPATNDRRPAAPGRSGRRSTD